MRISSRDQFDFKGF